MSHLFLFLSRLKLHLKEAERWKLTLLTIALPVSTMLSCGGHMITIYQLMNEWSLQDINIPSSSAFYSTVLLNGLVEMYITGNNILSMEQWRKMTFWGIHTFLHFPLSSPHPSSEIPAFFTCTPVKVAASASGFKYHFFRDGPLPPSKCGFPPFLLWLTIILCFSLHAL